MKNKPRNRGNAPNSKKFTDNPKNRSFQRIEEGFATLWGLHAVSAALNNPDRTIKKAVLSRNAAIRIGLDPDNLQTNIQLAEPKEIDAALPDGAVHQGAMLTADFLEPLELESAIEDGGPIVILDQVTDPMNVGAILRSAAAFGVRTVVMQTRKSPPFSGVLAKAAVGAVETVREIRVVNIARTIDALCQAHWNVIGLSGDSEDDIATAFNTNAPIAIVLGAEGSGLRPAVAKACTQLARIPISGAMESLNVSNAAAIALYEIGRASKR
ncbi:MAG: 23S rRNA (guanosine(2251)-2'-O)-methyltransferase RlmB [Hirschia sp.]|nr:23S rRNA (guanosine(2251)-2'-O)-methyltransferase RlmB [Hirschia sp.]MBB36718.1 23S rRNA (guanosine(2251)-2'-O)-methyltransferase RlmB [Hirschia sp.]MBF18067.1 23S rRNA (guanosine(2251)-2'-O)-methyltransferase RlmB [Hirschia sp.]